jgi:hypothetical protein
VRRVAAIVTAFLVAWPGAWCACGSATLASVARNTHHWAHACCKDVGGPLAPDPHHDGHQHCPHCQGFSVAPASGAADAQAPMPLLPAFASGGPFDAAHPAGSPASPVALHPPSRAIPPTPTLLGLHCALTL